MENTSHQNQGKKPIDLAAIRERLEKEGPGQAWRSLEELAETEEFVEFLEEEFPRQASGVRAVTRRDFLKFLAAPLALAGLTACVPQPLEKIVPYVNAPAEITPGNSLNFATAMELDGYGMGLIVQSAMGRPIKVEGNPSHPASLGATDPFAQGSVLTLYDPDRTQTITYHGQIRTWDSFLQILNEVVSSQSSRKGAGLRILTGPVTSPTLASQLSGLLVKFPQAHWHQYSPMARDTGLAGALMAFGEPVQANYRFDKADVILSLDDDFTFREPGKIPYSRQYADRRRAVTGNTHMNRLYVVESGLSNAGALADHRLALQASQIENFAWALAQTLGVPQAGSSQVPLPEAVPPGFLQALAGDLQEHTGASLVIAGPQQSPIVHALAFAMNSALGNIGQTVIFHDPVEARPGYQFASLADLNQALNAGEVELLLVIEGNPVYTAPVDFNFAENYQKAGLSIYLSLFDDETAAVSDWHIPTTHYLEMWSDTRAFDGTISFVQPLIAPLYDSKSPHEFLSAVLGDATQSGYDLLRNYWQGQASNGAFGNGDFERAWEKTLHDGLIAGSALPEKQVSLATDFGGAASPPAGGASGAGLEIVFAPDHCLWDGRFANNAWLQELPRPLTKLTWDNAALIGPATAERLGLTVGDVIELQYRQRSVRAPVWVHPGQPVDSITVNLGYGRTAGGHLAAGTGFNAYALRTSQAPWFDHGLQVRKVGSDYPLADTQHHNTMEGRDFVKAADIGQFLQNPDMFQPEIKNPPSLYPEYPYNRHKWGMSINLNACIGCSACVIACQAENNIPVVGKEQVLDGHEMHWLRIDRYFTNLESPQVYFQPVPCMQCEKAPCEPVCPVDATLHDEEGLNEMIYNRCVGTRYCSNNCPYKVRRFNFLQFTDDTTIPLKMVRNPEVTVRSRGVMEKCTYCIQRITKARIQSEIENRPIPDGEIQTACQQVCPTNAIVFGDLNDANSQVVKLKAEPTNYRLLEELDTQPRTSYLAKLRNPNPKIDSSGTTG